VKYLKSQNGVALITAMLVVALAAILASALVSQLFLDIRRTANIFQSEQAHLYNLNAENIALFTLAEDEKFPTTKEFDDLAQYSKDNEQSYPVPGGSITGSVIDLQGRFNLNNLSPLNETNQKREITRFKNLLTALEINTSLHNELTDSLIDWIDDANPPNSQTSPFGAEYDYYIGLEHPYRPANDFMTSATELRMVKGFNEVAEGTKKTIYDILKDHICTLPAHDINININTATPEVLEALENIDHGLAEEVTQQREESSFSKLDDFLDIINSKQPKNKKLKSFDGAYIASEYFLLTSTAQIGENKVTMYSTIFREASPGNGPDGRIRIIRRSIGKGTW
jgi:general secretion pathway protein K